MCGSRSAEKVGPGPVVWFHTWNSGGIGEGAADRKMRRLSVCRDVNTTDPEDKAPDLHVHLCFKFQGHQMCE